MADKKDWREEYKKKHSEESKTETGNWRDKYKEYYDSIYAKVAGEKVTEMLDQWQKNYNSYISDYTNRFSGRKGTYEDAYVSDSADWLNSATEKKAALDNEAMSIFSYLNQYGGHLDAKWVQDVRDTLSKARDSQLKIQDIYAKDNAFWSSFENEDAYKYAGRVDGYSKKYDGMTYENIQAALDDLPDGEERQWLQYMQGDLFNDYVKGQSDYKQYAQKGAGMNYASFDTVEQGAMMERGNEYLGAIAALFNHFGTEKKYGGHLQSYVDLFQNLTEDEWNVLAYSVAKDRENGFYTDENGVAQLKEGSMVEQFLRSMEGSLEQSAGEKEAARYKDIPVIADLYAAKLGLSNFATGFNSFVNNNDTGYGSGTTQVAGSIIRESFADDGFKLPEWMGGASARQALFDLTSTTSQQIPTIAVSSLLGTINPVFGKVAGTALMGTSAAGNAYSEALDKGYGKKEARLYGSAVGALEGTLQYLLGGISKLGGVSSKLATAVSGINSGLARFALQYGGQIASEGLEEGLQEIFDPLLQRAIMDADADIDWSQVTYSALLGALSAGTLEIATTVQSVKEQTRENNAFVSEYGGLAKDVIKNGTEGSKIGKIAEKYQKKLGKGKNLTASQVRKVLESSAQERLTELGEDGNTAKIAKMAVKYASGQELTRAEKKELSHSKFGAQVSKEIRASSMLHNWMETAAETEYESLESRMEEEAPAKVSDTGVAVISGTDQQVDLTAPKIKKITKDSVILEVDGKDVDIDEIDFANEDQWNVFNALKKIEHITPSVASDMIAKIDTSKPIWGQMNGMDEAFTYGYYNYSEADLKAGLFTGNLTKEQLNDAYKLGQYVRKNNVEADETNRVKMRTEADAKLTAEQKAAQQKARIEFDDVDVYFMDGKSTVKFDEHTGKYDPKRTAAVNTAKFLKKLGIGGKFVFYESYEKNGKRYYKDANGNEVEAPNGFYDPADGSIYIDLNAGNDGSGKALFTMGHELAHFVKHRSEKQFKILSDMVAEAFDKTNLSMHKRVLEKQAFLQDIRGNTEKVSYTEAYEEVVADAMSTMLTDGSFYDTLMEIKVKHKDLFATIKKFFTDMIAKFKQEYANIAPDQRDARDIRALKDAFDKIQQAFAESLVEASENFQAEQVQKNTTEDGGVMLMSREEGNSIKSQIVAVSDQLNKMDVVASVNTDGFEGMRKSDIAKAVEAEYSKFGKQVDRQNFGIILLEYAQINKALEYLYTPGEKAALLTVPKVLKRGIIADFHPVHKDRKVDSFTIAAPVEINGKRGNVGVVVQRVSGTNRFKTLRILLPNGKAFEFEKNNEADSTAGGSSKPNGSKGTPIESASKNSIRNNGGIVNTESAEALDLAVDAKTESVAPAVLKSERDSTGKQLTEEQVEFFKDSKIRDKHGNLLVVRHGTNDDFHIFDFAKSGKNGKAEGYGFYFSDDAEITKRYGDIQKEVYLNITKPLYNNKRTIKKAELVKLTNALIDFNLEKFKSDGLVWQDSFISNYVNTYEHSMSRRYAVHEFVNQIWEYNTNDQDLVFEIAQGDGKMYDSSSMKEFYNVLTESIGYDGIIAEWTHADGLSNVYVTFDSEQSKYTSNTKPTSNPDMRYSERNTETDQTDIHSRIFDLQSEEGRLNRSIKEIEDSEDFKAVQDRMFNADSVEAGVNQYLEWKEKSGYGALLAQRDSVRDELKKLREERDNNYADESAEKERQAIAKSGLSEAAYFRKQAVNEFGYTPYFYDAGYLTPNGKMLNFSGEKGKHFGSRGQDHRSIGIIYENTQGSDAMVRFMNDGNIRIMAETPGLDISSLVEPTKEQYAQIRKFARENGSKEQYFAVDISDENGRVIGNYEYDGYVNADRVVNDIKYFFEHGEVREQSSVARFLNSDRNYERDMVKQDRAYLDAVNRGNTETAQKLVDEAAKNAGYDSRVFHGTDAFGFTKLDVSQSDDGISFFATDRLETARTYSDGDTSQVRRLSGERDGDLLESKEIFSEEEVSNIAKNMAEFMSSEIGDANYIDGNAIIDSNASDFKGLNKIAQKWMRDVYETKYSKERKNGLFKRYKNFEDFEISNKGFELRKKVDAYIRQLLHQFGLKNGTGIETSGIYDLYANTENHLIVECGNSSWNKIESTNLPDTSSKEFEKYRYGNKAYWTTRSVAAYAKDLGYSGVTFKNVKDTGGNGFDKTPATVYAFFNPQKQVKSADPITYDDNGNVIPLSQRFNTENDDIRYSERGEDSSNRSLLANAFEGITQNSEEYKLIQKYKGHIKDLNALDKALGKINAEIREIRFGKGKYDAKKLSELETKAKAIASEITRHDKELLSLEASEPLRKVIQRERKKEAQKTKAHVQEIQQNKKVRAEQAEYRYKIRKTIRDLDKILNRGNKKLNVKEDMKGFASKALELADYLFTDHISNDDLIRKGITVRMTQKEAALVKETEDILSKLYDHADSLTDEEFTQLDAQRKKNLDKLRDLLTAQRNERLNTPVYNLFNDLVTEYAGLKNSNQDAVKDSYDPNVERFLRSYIGETNGETDSDRKTLLQNMRVADMTTDELWKLHNAYKMVLHSVRTANELFVKGKAETLEQKASRIMGDFANRKIPDKKVAIIARNIANKIGWDYEKLYYALDRIGSEAFTELVTNIANSENIVMQDIMEAVAFRDEMIKEYGFNNWAVNKEIDREFLDNTGKKFKLTLGQLMALYAYSRRDGAWDHIEYGGFVFGKAALTNPKPADSYKLSKAQCEAITGLLTKEQKGYAEDMQKFLSETMGEKGNEVSMLLYGIKMFGEKNYFPIHVAGQFKAQANESQAKAAAGFSSMSNAGFTHAQNPNAKAPFVLEGFNEIWSDHVNEMSRYHGTVPALEDMRRVMNRSFYSESGMESMAIKQLMENAFGKEAVDYFDNLYREANSGAITDKLEQKHKKLLSLFRKNSVAYSLSVVIQQPSAMSRAYAMIDKKYFGFKGVGALTSGVAKAVSSKWNPAYANAYNEMKKYAPGVTMAKEIGGFDTHTGSSIREYLLDTGKSFKQSMQTENLKGKAKAALDLVDNNAIANLPTVADKIAWIEIWNACKRETLAKHRDLAPNSEEFMQAVGERFTEVIRATQVYDSMFSKSPMLKSKNLAVQYLVSFMNEPNTTANMVEKAVRDAIKGDWKSGVRTAAAVTSSIIFNNVLKAVIYAMRDDDEDETYIEKYAEAVVSGMIADFNPLSYIPYVRDVVSKLQGYDVERPDMAIVTDAIEAYQAIVKNTNKDTENLTERQLAELDKKVTDASWKLVGSVAAFFGIPVKNIYREIDGIIDHARIASANAGMTTPSSVWNKVTASIPFLESETAKADKLYEAILSGDKAYIDRLKAGYVDKDGNFSQSKYDSAVVKALRENDPRIKVASQAGVNGNSAERNRIFKEIKSELGADYANYIILAINAEVEKIRNDAKPDKVHGQYGAYDFVEAVSAGDANTAKAVREDIISTYKANGKTQTQAEKAFVSDVKSSVNEAYSYGTISKATAVKMLVEYADMDEEDAADKITYWDFCKTNPNCDLSESKVLDYLEFAEPAHVSLEVYEQFVSETKGLADIKDKWGDVEVTKREQVLEVIDSLPLSWQQKDALYLAYGYEESQIWDVPW
jgi:hypothetical protein